MPLHIAIIGGSGLRSPNDLDLQRDHHQTDPLWGSPSSPVITYALPHAKISFLNRHGDGHFIPPNDVPYRANIAYLKQLGVTHVIAFCAVGTLNPDIQVKQFVAVDQYLDFTHGRDSSFFNQTGAVAHLNMFTPVCPQLTNQLVNFIQHVAPEANVKNGACAVTIQGPHFATAAELKMYRMLGADLIGMTTVTEAKLCREACIHYTNIAMVTDQAFGEGGATVSHELVENVMKHNSQVARKIIDKIIEDPNVLSLLQPCQTCPPNLHQHVLTIAEDKLSKQQVQAIKMIVQGRANEEEKENI